MSFTSQLKTSTCEKRGQLLRTQQVFAKERNFSWKALWDWNADWLCLRYESQRRSGTQVESPCLGGDKGRAPSLDITPWHSPYNWGNKLGKNFSQGSQLWTISNIPTYFLNTATYTHFINGALLYYSQIADHTCIIHGHSPPKKRQ